MKFQPDSLAGTNAISRHDPGAVWVNGQRHEGSVIVPWRGTVQAWSAVDFESLHEQHFQQVLALRPELVIFGSGARLRFASPGLYRALIEARVGLETMDSGAACRTYNVLASEGRSVVAALL
ncbi:MAG TPA: Mth938-like domain-containing protein [Burkholderiaceae bacterium]|nr:Mth938-like domain-containing protein [Burkholderiaceae bacterium]